jgi:WS/DGAT/MGAT family acyltransferase
VALGSMSLADVKEIKTAFGATVNDVVLAVVTHGLRRYLAAHDRLPDRALVCSVPVSVHGSSRGASANQVSNMFVSLPVHLDDPIDRLRAVQAAALDAKRLQGVVGSDTLSDVVDLLPPRALHLAAAFYSQARLADRLPPVHNLVVSNVPGSPVPLYFAGARLAGIFPLGPLMEGAALNISVISNLGELDIGVISCPDLAPRLRDLVSGVREGVTVLLERARSVPSNELPGEPRVRRPGPA